MSAFCRRRVCVMGVPGVGKTMLLSLAGYGLAGWSSHVMSDMLKEAASRFGGVEHGVRPLPMKSRD
jgi:adenylate kinase